MLHNNKHGFTLVELLVYTSIFILVGIVVSTIFQTSFLQNTKSTMNLEFLQNVSSGEKYIRKASENTNGIVLIRHEQVNTVTSVPFGDISILSKSYNGHLFNIGELISNCGFITDDNFDIVALSTEDGLDPVVIGVIENQTESGRVYRQLAIYRYYSTYTELEKIETDYKNGAISRYYSDEGQLQTTGLDIYKCNTENGFLIPISSKNYQDLILDFDYSVGLDSFKVLPYGLDDIDDGFSAGLIEYELGWSIREKEVGRTIYQTISKSFNYE